MTDPAPAPTPAATAPVPRKRRSFGVRVLKWTGIVVASLVVLVLVALYMPGVRQWAFEQGRSILAEAGVQSDSVSGEWTEMHLAGVALTDDEGVWLTAQEIVLSWSPWGLLSGTVDATHVELRGARLLREPAYKPAPDQADEPFAWPDLPVDITLHSLTGDLAVDQVVFGEALTAALNGKAALTSGGGDAEISLTRTDGVLGEMSLTARSNADLGDVEIKVNAKDQRVVALVTGDDRLSNLEVAFQATRVENSCTGQAAISARDGALATVGVNPNCTFAVQLPEVARLLDASAGLSGPANLSVQLIEDGTDKTTHFQLGADLSQLVSTDPQLAALLPGASAGALVMFTAGGVQVNNLQGQLASGKIAFTGSALVGDAVQAKADINASDLSVLRSDLKGQLQASFAYDTGAATPIAFTAKGTNVVAGDLGWASVDAIGNINAAGTGTVTLKAAGPVPIDLAVAVADAFGTALTVNAKGTVAGANVVATAAQSGATTKVDATIDTKRLDHLGALAGIAVSGGLKARVSGTLGAPDAGLTLEASVSGARYGGTEIGDATLTARGPMNALEIDLKGRAPLAPRVVDYSLAAVVADFGSARISALSVKSQSESLTATAPFTVDFAKDILVRDLNVSIARAGKNAGTIAANAELTPGGAKATATFKSIDLEALMALLSQQPVRGTLNATASLDGGAGRAELTGTVEGLRAGGDAARVPPANLALNGQWTGGRVSVTVTARAEGLPDATIRAAFPMARAADGGFPSPAPNAPLEGAVDWTGRIAPLWRLADIGNADLDGDARIQATIGGTLEKPQFAGSATIANGALNDEGTGLRLAAINIAANVEGDRVTVKGSATDGARGSMTIDAAAGLTGGIGGASGGITLSAMQPFARDDLVARLDGSLNLARGANGPLLNGKLSVSGIEAQIPEPGPPDLVKVDVIDPDKPKPVEPEKAPRAPGTPPPSGEDQTLALDVDIAIPGPAKVRGRGLDTIWRGNLRLFGDATDPRVEGKLTIMRGTWEFGPRSFNITDGSIEFDGGPTIEPRIDITATQEEDGFTGSLKLSGRASAPQISASSVPAAPQDEVFARLLFGRSVTSLSPLEGLQLANSIAEISGMSGGGPGVLTTIKDRFGLDVLTVDLGKGGDATVRAGRYLTDKVYFELRQGGDSAGTRGVLELQIDENLSVETEVGADSSSSVGGRYRYDY